MLSLQCNLAVLFFLQVAVMFLQHSSEGAVFNNSINSTSATNSCNNITNEQVYNSNSTSATNSCNDITYEQVYNSLAKSENSFNIESALYPAKKPSSVRVFVNVHGPNKTAKYTWSISCLYAAFPARVLEVWSLGSIMVTRRTQELKITISILGCDVTEGKLKEHIEAVLAALQDLAVSPGIRDPQLNSAECVTEGHEQHILATGQNDRMIIILCFSCLISVLSGPLLVSFVIHYQERSSPEIKKTIHVLCGCLLVIFILLSINCIVYFSKSKDKFLTSVDILIPVVGLVVGCCECHCCPNDVKWYAIPYAVCANLTVYHFCWLLIGIMLNPIWGLAVLLIVCLVIGVFTYMVFAFVSSDNDHRCQSFFSCLAAFLAICFLIVVVILAGQSYHGRQTADEFVKDGVLFLISVSFSWLYWKHRASTNSTSTSEHQLVNNNERTGISQADSSV